MDPSDIPSLISPAVSRFLVKKHKAVHRRGGAIGLDDGWGRERGSEVIRAHAETKAVCAAP